MIPKWIQEIEPDLKPDDFTHPLLRALAEKSGVNSALALAELYGGRTEYIPKLDESMKLRRDRAIIEEYNGYNAKELATKYNLTDSRVRQLVSKNDPNQLSLNFDEDE